MSFSTVSDNSHGAADYFTISDDDYKSSSQDVDASPRKSQTGSFTSAPDPFGAWFMNQNGGGSTSGLLSGPLLNETPWSTGATVYPGQDDDLIKKMQNMFDQQQQLDSGISIQYDMMKFSEAQQRKPFDMGLQTGQWGGGMHSGLINGSGNNMFPASEPKMVIAEDDDYHMMAMNFININGLNKFPMNGDVDVLAQRMNLMSFSAVNGGDVGGGQQFSPSIQQQLPSENGYGMVQNGQQQTGPREAILGNSPGKLPSYQNSPTSGSLAPWWQQGSAAGMNGANGNGIGARPPMHQSYASAAAAYSPTAKQSGYSGGGIISPCDSGKGRRQMSYEGDLTITASPGRPMVYRGPVPCTNCPDGVGGVQAAAIAARAGIAQSGTTEFLKSTGMSPGGLMPTQQQGLSSAFGAQSPPASQEVFSKKVFVGGLPPDIDETEIRNVFQAYGQVKVDWPHKSETRSYFPPKGYCFLIFTFESSVQALIAQCSIQDGKYFMLVSSPTIKDKQIQIRPWCLADADYVHDPSLPLDPRKTVFIGGVPRPLKAKELAMIMDRLYGGVCYAGIDTDPDLKYPKGAGRVAFLNQQSYIAAISARFVHLQMSEMDKRAEIKPYVLDDQQCDECGGARCNGKTAPFFCANVMCLQYYCEQCWQVIHSQQGREYHKPLVKEGSERPRAINYPWSHHT